MCDWNQKCFCFVLHCFSTLLSYLKLWFLYILVCSGPRCGVGIYTQPERERDDIRAVSDFIVIYCGRGNFLGTTKSSAQRTTTKMSYFLLRLSHPGWSGLSGWFGPTSQPGWLAGYCQGWAERDLRSNYFCYQSRSVRWLYKKRRLSTITTALLLRLLCFSRLFSLKKSRSFFFSYFSWLYLQNGSKPKPFSRFLFETKTNLNSEKFPDHSFYQWFEYCTRVDWLDYGDWEIV
jgi:hypothetical protein